MRGLLVVMCVLAFGCKDEAKFTDAGGVDPGDVDAAAVPPDALDCAAQACAPGDTCCPDGCNANNDSDCAAACDNGVIESGETCDPLASCPGDCPAVGCQLRTLTGAGTCAAACVDAGLQTVCQSGDGCCPDGCNADNDAECAAVCDNGVEEPGETCDPLSSCPTACPQVGCSLFTLFNAGTCQAQCVETAEQGMCLDGDGCCPTGCNANNDGDCAPLCGNGAVEPGETCDGNCACPAESVPCFYETGSATTCDLRCHNAQQTCGLADQCCPMVPGTGGDQCDSGTDSECNGPAWRFVEWYQLITWSDVCRTINIYNFDPGDNVLFTTCSPDGGSAVGDPVITSVVDNLGNSYPVANDDCVDPGAIPVLAGWNCLDDQGLPRMSCAPANSGGIILSSDPSLFSLQVTVCGHNNTSGRSRFFIWWNGTSNPNPG